MPDALFPTDNDFEIPELDPEMMAETCEIPFCCFGEQKRTYDMEGRGTLHFYTDDYRFRSVYNSPEKILGYRPHNIVEPNFSLFNETPIAFGLQAVYMKRCVARHMQRKGIRVFVDLNVANKWYAYNLLGVPEGWNAFCTRGYSDRINALCFEYRLAQRVSGREHPLFVVYNGGEPVKLWAREHQAVYVTPVVSVRRRSARAQRDMADNTARVSHGIDRSELGDIIEGQTEDNTGLKPAFGPGSDRPWLTED